MFRPFCPTDLKPFNLSAKNKHKGTKQIEPCYPRHRKHLMLRGELGGRGEQVKETPHAGPSHQAQRFLSALVPLLMLDALSRMILPRFSCSRSTSSCFILDLCPII